MGLFLNVLIGFPLIWISNVICQPDARRQPIIIIYIFIFFILFIDFDVSLSAYVEQ